MTSSSLRACAIFFLALALMSPGDVMASVAATLPGPSVDATTDATLVAKRKKRRKGKKKKRSKKDEPAAEETPPAAEEPPAAPQPPAAPTEQPAETVPSPPPPAVDPVAVEAPVAVPPEVPDDSTVGAIPAVAAAAETIEAKPIDTMVDTAEPPTEPAPQAAEEMRESVFPLTFGIEVGVGFPQVVSDLRTAFIPSLEIGYLLPVMEQRLEVFVSGAYSFPDQSKVVEDSRFTNSEDFRFRITEQELLTTLGGSFRIFPPRAWLNFYGQLGMQVRWQRSEVRGNANGEPLGINYETKTEVGAMVAGGVELLFGPGALAAELGFAFSDLDHRVTGESSAGGLTLQLGYHFLL